MNDRTLDQLIRLAVESELADDKPADDPRSAECLTMGRLDALAAARLGPSSTEQRHLRSCPLCTGRLRALQRFARVAKLHSRSSRPGVRRVIGLAVAVAAMVLAAIYVPTRWPDNVVPAVVTPVSSNVAISVCHEPPLLDAPGQRHAGQFVVMTEQPCTAVAIYRECEVSCDCREWRLHQWDDKGRTVADLDPDELLEIAVDSPGERHVGQLLVLASARRPEVLPGSPDDAACLLDCLNDVALSGCPEYDAAAYASALRECLPASVTLVERTFRGE